MSRPLRSEVFDPDEIGLYHCYNRIVRRSFLCGYDPHTGKDYSHRRQWLYQRLRYLAEFFALDVLGYAILSNHFHLILRNRPDLVEAMDDREVVRRWLMICPKKRRQDGYTVLPPTEKEIRAELHRDGRAEELRKRLAHPSWLLRQVSQHMGIRCNAEDEMRGHFWESRYGMKRLLDEAALLSCLTYVDLNPQRAHLAEGLEDYPFVSIAERLQTLSDEPIETSSWLAPIAVKEETNQQPVQVVNPMTREELADAVKDQAAEPLGCLPMTLEQYAELLRWLSLRVPTAQETSADASLPGSQALELMQKLGLDPQEFAELVREYSHRFYTAVGCRQSLQKEAVRRGRRRLKAPGCGALSHRRVAPVAST